MEGLAVSARSLNTLCADYRILILILETSAADCYAILTRNITCTRACRDVLINTAL